MKNIKTFLDKWINEGFISNEQAQKILAFESKRGGKNWAFYSFIILGVTVIGIGVISLIAANWNGIADSIKLLSTFLILIGLAYSAFTLQRSTKQITYEAILTTFFILCLATIGLISQIYHTGGELYEAVFFWTLMTLSVALISKKLFIPFIWTSSFLISAILMIGFKILLNSSTEITDSFALSIWIGTTLATPLFSAIAFVLLRLFDKGINFQKSFLFWAVLGWICMVLTGDIAASILEREVSTMKPLITFLIPSALLAAFILFAVLKSKKFSHLGRILFVSLIILYFFEYFAIFYLSALKPFIFLKTHGQFTGSFLSILTFMAGAFFTALEGNKKIFNILIVLVGVRFVVLYFQALGGLAQTGLGLIVSGIFIIALVYLWHKFRKQIFRLIEGLANR